MGSFGYISEIRSFRGEYRFLSNFYLCDISYDGLTYGSLEAAFQAAKCANIGERARFQSLGPSEAKRAGRSVALRSDWEDVKLSVLAELIRLKFTSNPELINLLLATGDAYLSEGNTWHDNYYGNCTCARCSGKPGLNNLGHALMNFRSQMRGIIRDYEKNTASGESSIRYRIYQASLESGQAFCTLESVKMPDPNAYVLVYEGILELGGMCDDDYRKLEKLYSLLNSVHPKDYKARSLSVSDVVELFGDGPNRFYFCDTIGFKPIDFKIT